MKVKKKSKYSRNKVGTKDFCEDLSVLDTYLLR